MTEPRVRDREARRSDANDPLVSVVIPAFNAEPWIGDALASALAQDHSRLEVIVVDDGSTDSTAAVARTDPRVRVLSFPNGGVARARNRGLAAVHGEYVSFLDADDLWAPAKITRQLDALSGRAGAFAVCGIRRFIDGAAGREWTHETEPPACEGMSVRDVLFLRNDQMAVFTTGLFPTADLRALGGWCEGLAIAEDWELWLRVSPTLAVTAVREPLYFYRKHPASATRRARLDDVLDIQLSLIERERAAGTVAPRDAERAVREKLLEFATAAEWRNEPLLAARSIARGLLQHGGIADREYYRTIVRMASRAAAWLLRPRAGQR